MSRFTPLALALAAMLVVGTACQQDHKSDMKMSGKPLWDRLGGEPAVRAVVDEFVARASTDPKVNFTRQGHPNHWDPTPDNVAKLKQRLVEFISYASGGPLQYKGRDMKTVHTGMGITSAEFDAAAADLAAALDKYKVKDPERGELLKVVGGTKSQIVNQ